MSSLGDAIGGCRRPRFHGPSFPSLISRFRLQVGFQATFAVVHASKPSEKLTQVNTSLTLIGFSDFRLPEMGVACRRKFQARAPR
jgi:hypothetical protein